MISSLRNHRTTNRFTSNGRTTWVSLLFVLLVSSCSSNELFNEYRALNREGWHRDSVVHFQVPVGDSVSRFDLFLQVRHTGRLVHSNLWTVIGTYGPDSSWVSTDTVELKLADEWGNWLGAGSGPAIDLQALYRPNLLFQYPGTYRFVVQHVMRDTLVPDLTHIGFRIVYKNGKE